VRTVFRTGRLTGSPALAARGRAGVNGDGWYNYYGWPTDADAPFRFTAEGTEIDQLVYGKLGVPRVVPWDEVPSGYGRHTVEYRAIDAPGNIGTPERFAGHVVASGPDLYDDGHGCPQRSTGGAFRGHVSGRCDGQWAGLDRRDHWGSGPGRIDGDRSGFGCRRADGRARRTGRHYRRRAARVLGELGDADQPAGAEPRLRAAIGPMREALTSSCQRGPIVCRQGGWR
jgi:hypothetical protein